MVFRKMLPNILIKRNVHANLDFEYSPKKNSRDAFDAFQYNSFLNRAIHTSFRSRRENPEIQPDLIDGTRVLAYLWETRGDTYDMQM